MASPAALPAAGTYSARLSGLLAPGLDCGALAAWSGGALGSGAAGADARFLAGADFKLDLGIGLFGEALCSLAPDSGDLLLRAATGADWSAGGFVFSAEYYWNGGVDAADDAYGAGPHNLYCAASWNDGAYLSLGTRLLWDIEGGTGSLLVLASLDAAQGSTLSAYARLARTQAAAEGWAAEAGLISIQPNA